MAFQNGRMILSVFFPLEDNILKEFREFAIRGNVMDLAIAVIIGGGIREDHHLAGERCSDAADRACSWRRQF